MSGEGVFVYCVLLPAGGSRPISGNVCPLLYPGGPLTGILQRSRKIKEGGYLKT